MDEGRAENEDMVRDDKPMLPIHANGVELAQRYGHVPARAKGEPKPWHVALVVWWRFVRRREAMEMARKIGRDMQI